VKRFFDGLNTVLILAMLGFALWAWPRLPSRVPIHFGMDGLPDGWTEKGISSWFTLPGVAVLLTLLMGTFRVLMRRFPRLVNLPDRSRLADLPEEARGPVLEMLSGFLALVQTELLIIFGLVQVASFRSAMGEPSQGLMIIVLILAVLTSPILLVVFFLRLQPALDRGKELARRKAAGVAGVCLLATLPFVSLLSACIPGEGGGPGRERVSLFLRPTEFGQALGWQAPSWAPDGSFMDTGFTGTFVMGVPSGNLGVVLLTNRQNRGTGADTRYPELEDLQRAVVEALLGSDGVGRRDGSGR
jgi:hypothetical protein